MRGRSSSREPDDQGGLLGDVETTEPVEETEPVETAATAATPTHSTRRDFLKFGGVAAAGAVVGGGIGAAAGAAVARTAGFAESDAFAALTPRSAPGFDHLVVVMGENRSFDNLLGYLYTPDDLPQGASFDGLAFGDYANTAPDGSVVAAHVYEGPTDDIMGRPNPDPGEEFPHVNTQLFDTIRPETNSALYVEQMAEPWNTPESATDPSMSGFVHDYFVNYARLKKGDAPSIDEARQIMGGFGPGMLPVLSALAKNFAVFDAWHCGVPSQTFCNRSFFHASTSHGFVTNKHGGGYEKWLDADPAPTIFNRLEEAGLSWRIYFDELQLVSFTGVLHAPVLEQYWRTDHFATMRQFYQNTRDGTLPAYAFIEPRMIYNHNDFHPPFSKLRESRVDGEEVIDSAMSDVRAGEALIHQLYDAIRSSNSRGGSNALNTMLLITFDEHGGTYDHVAPPAAVPPGDGSTGEMGFAFDRLGCRVPAIAVSAYTRAGTIVHDRMDHGSVIATLSRLHGLQPLTKRDAASNDLLGIVNLNEPRHPMAWPATTPQYLPPNPQASAPHPAHAHKDKPLSPPARGLVGILMAKYAPGTPEPETYAEAYELLHRHGEGLFGAPA